jgi:outer membrane PBP1 activator LpoA protein
MLIKSLKVFAAGLALAAVSSLVCASTQANTSAPQAPEAKPDAPAPEAKPIRVALMLPLRSDTLGPPAEAVRAGFMAAYEQDGGGLAITVIETGDTVQQALDAYAGAVAANDIVVGPLARQAVGAVASSPAAIKPTIALNYPDSKVNVPQQMLIMGLSIEDEARQVALWAHDEHPNGPITVVSGTSSWQRRIAASFSAQFKQLGHAVQQAELPASNGYLSEAGINQLKLKFDAEPPGMLFAALDADQLRQVRSIVGPELPVYGTSSSNPGMPMAELDGLHLLDLPWLVQPDHPAVMSYPRRTASGPPQLDLDRLYALGIDAYRVARQIAGKPQAPFRIDGVTGRLLISFGQGLARFERQQPAVILQGATFKATGR